MKTCAVRLPEVQAIFEKRVERLRARGWPVCDQALDDAASLSGKLASRSSAERRAKCLVRGLGGRGTCGDKRDQRDDEQGGQQPPQLLPATMTSADRHL